MLPFRFGVHVAVAPTMSAWRDQARTPRARLLDPYPRHLRSAAAWLISAFELA